MSWGGRSRRGPRGPVGEDGAPGTDGATGAAGGGLVLDPIPFIIQQSSTARTAAGPYTVGMIFGVCADATLSWVEHYLIVSGTETYHIGIWLTGGAQVATTSVAVSSTGRTRFTLDTPLTLTPGLKYTYGIWNATNVAYCPQASSTAANISLFFPTTTVTATPIGNQVMLYHTHVYASGNNTIPTLGDSKFHLANLGGITLS